MANKLDKNGRFILLSYAKGAAHATLVPFALLWIFQGLELWAFAISALYVMGVGIMYKFSTRHDLSRAGFFGALLVMLMFASIVMVLAVL